MKKRSQPGFGQNPDGRSQEKLVKLNHLVRQGFAPAILAEATAVAIEPDPAEIGKRLDLRNLPFVTIDNEDSRDFDDAIHVQANASGWQLRVAIADVSHYVRPASGGKARQSLDGEAGKRGFSRYFPLSVEPMLPALLSDQICSLNPGVDRLVILADLAVARDGQIGQSKFASAVIRSRARLTYDQALACHLGQANGLADLEKTCSCPDSQNQGAEADPQTGPETVLLPAETGGKAGEPDGIWPDGQVRAMLAEAFAMFPALRSRRLASGSLDLDLPEPVWQFDRRGRIRSAAIRPRHAAHQLVEECMIAANTAVAEYLAQSGLPCLYRVHPGPGIESLQRLFSSLRACAPLCLPAGTRWEDLGKPGIIQAILDKAREIGLARLVERLCLRAMSHAGCSPANGGHFGLARECYCHFTSPIRRYADLVVHRALKLSLGLDHGPVPDGKKLVQLADRLNRLEKASQECERELDRRLACLLLQKRIGEEFTVLVSSITAFGLFASLENPPVDGFLGMEDLGNDYYEPDRDSTCLVGKRSGTVWRLGQSLNVRLAGVDMIRLEISLVPVELPKGLEQRKGRQKNRKRQGRPESAGCELSGKRKRPAKTDRNGRDQKRSGSRPQGSGHRRGKAKDWR